MNNRDVYFAEIKKILPQQYPSTHLADIFYPTKKYGEVTNKLSKRLAKKIQISKRACTLNLDAYPIRVLKNEEDHPINWGAQIINQLTTNISKIDIGFFSLSYNISFHLDTLPNLATQMALSAGLNHLDKVEEISDYGCAAGIYSIENAIAYCKEYNRPAIVFTFDQCLAKCLQIDRNDEDFGKLLVTNLLFADGGVGTLLVPEAMKNNFDHSLMKIKGTMTKYKMGNLIGMKKQRFLMSRNLKDIMPKLVSDLLLKPFLKQQDLEIDDIEEWAIHQGGTEVIKQFHKEEILGLSEKQTERSLDKFYEYGNVSSASCLLVLESFFNNPKRDKENDAKGILLGFGAGYYLGVLLYEWETRTT